MVTGAAGGLGRAFVAELIKEELDEIWSIGRNREKLARLKELFGDKIIPVCKDLTDTKQLKSVSVLLKEEKADVRYLVNNAGIARMAPSEDFSPEEIERTIDLNCKAPVLLMNYCLLPAVFIKGKQNPEYFVRFRIPAHPVHQFVRRDESFRAELFAGVERGAESAGNHRHGRLSELGGYGLIDKGNQGRQGKISRHRKPRTSGGESTERREKGKGYVRLFALRQMSASQREIDAAKADDEAMAEQYQKISLGLSHEIG